MMKYFSPELYLAFNSPDEAEADRAEAQWFEREARYKQRRDELEPYLTHDIRKLSRMCLYGGEVVTTQSGVAAPPPVADGTLPPACLLHTLSVKQGRDVTNLFYILSDELTSSPPPAGWRPRASGPQVWMYDEVDMLPGVGKRTPSGRYVHRILFNSGEVVTIPFTGVMISEFKLPRESQTKGALAGTS
jgi:hypothetical protein